ncbi:MAG: Fe-S cluster assembly protein SufB [Halorhodospira halophila]|uniref:Fe-S cluster assembly protein SufB n=1 Tax=Halorhodospira TaxID=85108 RepID=UPI001914190E|nr:MULTISPECIES: Fe-S cluster assembly protein SufB [Halorhodospira]MBK5942861.1 Fe-S cluster assembly protein SufB [Halorhodospira halophila]MCC3750499.1 Fe-S cluster assembly protein SufB [Halorhodospira halophila]MCG5533442.1 Fe-S cluster assembly protein SufB [Halorhodospira sp. 9621]MCG5538726.1 Fe-S cluster assembly protein SufB [Halorhodospira sp. 9622]
MSSSNETIERFTSRGYEAGFFTDIEQEFAPPGLNEETIRFISEKKGEPEWMLEWRLEAYRGWLEMAVPQWQNVQFPPIDFQAISYYAAPKQGPKSLDEVDPKLLETYEKLGIPLHEQKMLAGVQEEGEPAEGARRSNVAVDAVFDSVSVTTTFKDELAKHGVIFCSISEALHEYPELVRQYIGSVVPRKDNFFAALNSAVFSDGSFVYIPEGVECPMELSTYFRINAGHTGQFERTLIIAEKGSSVSYLEGCTAPQRDENQLHAAVVELYAHDDAQIKYSTVQNWYPGDENGVGGVYNFVTKRGLCAGKRSKISWTQVETGSAITWKYPSCVLKGDDSIGEFYSVAVTRGRQQADTGTKMIHIGNNTRSHIISKGISADYGQQSYRGLVKVLPTAGNARNYSQCDSMLMSSHCGAHTFPYIDIQNPTAQLEHEATTSKIGDDQIFYCKQRGISEEDAVSMIVNGFCKEVFQELPMEFAVEAQKLLEVTLEDSVG